MIWNATEAAIYRLLLSTMLAMSDVSPNSFPIIDCATSVAAPPIKSAGRRTASSRPQPR
jgi:hypothetical protein